MNRCVCRLVNLVSGSEVPLMLLCVSRIEQTTEASTINESAGSYDCRTYDHSPNHIAAALFFVFVLRKRGN